MPWIEDPEHNEGLYSALRQLAAEKGALERLAGAINADARAKETEVSMRGDQHKRKNSLIVSETLFRWYHEGIARLVAAQSHKKRLVYEFLERSFQFKTDLYRPDSNFPPGLLTFIADHSERLAQPFEKDLRKLDGAYELFRPAWTTPRCKNRVLISKLRINTTFGLTQFREEQDYIDPEYHDAKIRETDEGIVFFTAANIIMLGFGVDAERVKVFVADTWREALNGSLPIVRFSGVMMGVAGRKHDPSFPFVAVRTKVPFHNIKTGIVHCDHERVPLYVRGTLNDKFNE